MHYLVTARLRSDGAAKFHEKLTDGTILAQKPDGREIVASMKRARLGPDGFVRWSEVCYCSPPLQHERESVYDHYFDDLQTEEAEDDVQFEGKNFMAHLTRLRGDQ